MKCPRCRQAWGLPISGLPPNSYTILMQACSRAQPRPATPSHAERARHAHPRPAKSSDAQRRAATRGHARSRADTRSHAQSATARVCEQSHSGATAVPQRRRRPLRPVAGAQVVLLRHVPAVVRLRHGHPRVPLLRGAVRVPPQRLPSQGALAYMPACPLSRLPASALARLRACVFTRLRALFGLLESCAVGPRPVGSSARRLRNFERRPPLPPLQPCSLLTFILLRPFPSGTSLPVGLLAVRLGLCRF